MKHCLHRNTVDTDAPYPYCAHGGGDHCSIPARYCLDCAKILYETKDGRWLTMQGWTKAEWGQYMTDKGLLVPCQPAAAHGGGERDAALRDR